MNVYDFDGTIYDGDSTIDFYLYCMRNNPQILKAFPIQIKSIILYKLKKIEKTEMKEGFYSFCKYIKNVDSMIESFWRKNEKKIFKWYMDQKEKTDVIISASPEFILFPMCKKLEIKELIASKVDKNTGKYDGKNCKGEEKVVRFCEKYEKNQIEKFYSDSDSDLPLAKIAKQSFFIKKGKIVEWKIEK